VGIGFSGVFDGILLGFYEVLIKLKGRYNKQKFGLESECTGYIDHH